jgi:molecular chaperone GrpE
MANYYDSFGPRQRGAIQGGQRKPTLDDYERLERAYRELQGKYQELAAQYQGLQQKYQVLQHQSEEQAGQLHQAEQALAIKDEALQRQQADMKATESELIWAKAALQQQEQAQQTKDGEEAQSWKEKYLRLQAEMENMRKRWDQRAQQQINQARDNILLDMLPLADHLDLALQHAQDITDPAAKKFVDSIEATRRAFMDTLKRYGVERIDAQDQPFDPNLHEAMGQVEHKDLPGDHVAHVVQAGYKEGDRLLRPARVLVSSETQNE